MDISTKTSSANLASSRLGRRSLVVWGAIAVGMAAIGGRITCVNAAAPKPTPVETYSLGETVPLDGAFGDVAEQGTTGYSVRLDGVTPPGTEFSHHSPYVNTGLGSARYDKIIADREFDWVLTNAPVRKVIHFSL